MNQNEIEVMSGGVSHPLSSLSDEARQQVKNLQFVDSEIARLNAQLAIYETARNSYKNALKDLLPQTPQ